jgi:uncharacterized protein (DUF1330 family)
MKTSNAIGLAIISGIAGAALVQSLHAQQKPKVYAVAEIEETDSAKFKPYLEGTVTTVPEAEARFLARGIKTFAPAGAPPKPVVAVVEWNSFEEAQAFFASDAYKNLIPSREAGSNFRALFVEGRQ